MNKRCLCLRSKVWTDSELLRFFREESIEGRTPYLGKVAGGGLLQREGWKCSRWEIWDKTSNFSDAPYHICFQRGFILRWSVELTLNAELYVWRTHRDRKFWLVFRKKLPKAAKFWFFWGLRFLALTVRKHANVKCDFLTNEYLLKVSKVCVDSKSGFVMKANNVEQNTEPYFQYNIQTNKHILLLLMSTSVQKWSDCDLFAGF